MARRLHIGGTVRSAGWEILNANPADYVDHPGDARDLSRFPDGTFQEIYASHVVEHLDYKDELKNTLVEWNRVLVPGGRVMISVPDLDILARLFLDRDRLNVNERFLVMRMIFGGHMDRHDYHLAGLNEEFLAFFLKSAGFVNLRRVGAFGLFEDSSCIEMQGVAISLNMTAEKPGAPG